MSHEQLALRFALHDGNLPQNHFRGLASAYNTLIDAYIPTRILPGAFTKTLREDAHRVKVLYQHNTDWPIGIPTRMEETQEGLLVEAKISQTTMGQEVLTLIRDKVLTELSIGFDSTRHELVDEGPSIGQVRHIKELRLLEFSPVSWAANKDARISSVNSLRRTSSDASRGTDVAQRVRNLQLAYLDAVGPKADAELLRAVAEGQRRYDAYREGRLLDLQLAYLDALRPKVR
jgi:HK97 family phage prohead protease